MVLLLIPTSVDAGQVAIAVASGVFGAGVALATVRLTLAVLRKDVNGIGKIQRRDRWNLMLALMINTESRDDRQRLADLMREQ